MFYMNDFVGQWLALLPDAKMVLDLCAQENFTSWLNRSSHGTSFLNYF